MAVIKVLKKLVTTIWSDHQSNELWQRIIKCSIACTAAVIMVITPQAVAVFGPSTFLAPMTTVFAHPGQRMGIMIEALLMILIGVLIGLAWSLFGLFLSSLVVDDNSGAGYAIRAMFLLASVLFHGYIRSSSPRLFLFVTFALIAAIIVLLGEAKDVTLAVFTHVYYPVLAGGAVVIVVNISMFPELSSSFLGLSTIDALCETMDTLTRATDWFITPGGDSELHTNQLGGVRTRATIRSAAEKPKKRKEKTWWREFLKEFPNPFKPAQDRYRPSSTPVHLTTLASLTGKKAKLRTRLARCKDAQKAVNFEVSISALPPSSMKPLSTSQMSDLVQSAVTLISACEDKFIVLENDTDSIGDDLTAIDTCELNGIARVSTADDYLKRLENAKPMREIEASSAGLLESILERIREPVQDFQGSLREAVRLVIVCLAYCYDVPRLPSGAPAPGGIHLEELDLRIDSFTEALSLFDTRCAEELRRSAMDDKGHSVDFMPRMETFLVSSFLLAFRQSALHVLKMLRHVRGVVEERQARNDRSSIWLPRHISIQQWLNTGGESGGLVLPEVARKEVRRGHTKPGSHHKDHGNSTSPKNRSASDHRDEETAQEEPKVMDSKASKKTRSRKSRKQASPNVNWGLKLRGKVADTWEWLQDSDDLAYGLKMAVAVFFVSWPALVTSWNAWYYEVRGIWAPLQLILVFEVAIGTSFFIFLVRLSGVIFGCVLGYLSYAIGNGNRVAMVFILAIGIVPSFYVQLGSKYVKAGMVSTVSMVVVALCKFDVLFSEL